MDVPSERTDAVFDRIAVPAHRYHRRVPGGARSLRLYLRPFVPVVLLISALIAGSGVRAGVAQETDAIRVRGGERIQWQQEAAALADVRPQRFRLYVDGVATPFEDVTCVAGATTGRFDCSGRLPAMTGGRHVLEISIVVGGVESRRAPISVIAEGTAAAPAAPKADPPDASALCIDGQRECYDVRKIAVTGRIEAVAALPDGRLLLVEDGRDVRVVAGGRLISKPAFGVIGEATRLVSLAISSDFTSSRSVFLGAIERHRNGSRSYVITRYGESANVLRPAGVMARLDAPQAGRIPMAADPNGRLYIALPGQILRVEPGAPERDRRTKTSTISDGIERPVALMWLASRGAFLLVGAHNGRNVAALISPDRSTPITDNAGRPLAASWSSGQVNSIAPVQDGPSGRAGVLLATTAGVYRNFGESKATLERLPFDSLGPVDFAVQDGEASLVLSVSESSGTTDGRSSLVRLVRRR